MSMVDKIERKSWALVRAYRKVSDLEKRQQEHKKSQKGVPAKDKVPFEPPTTIVAEKASYVIFKEKQLFFTPTI